MYNILVTSEIDRVFVSTDDCKISKASRELGAEVHERPAELATDTALVIDAIRHFHGSLVSEGRKADIIVLLEATSPFRTPALISKCLHRIVDENLDSIATFSEAERNPERCWRIEDDIEPRPFIEGAVPWNPRQLLTPAYQLNGAVYAFRPDRLPKSTPNILFGRMGAEVIPADGLVDIDNKRDFLIANAILES